MVHDRPVVPAIQLQTLADQDDVNVGGAKASAIAPGLDSPDLFSGAPADVLAQARPCSSLNRRIRWSLTAYMNQVVRDRALLLELKGGFFLSVHRICCNKLESGITDGLKHSLPSPSLSVMKGKDK